jgi:hypothetical protein
VAQRREPTLPFASILISIQPILMRYLIPLFIAIAGIAAANATVAHVEGWLDAEEAEYCHRRGFLDCPPMPR